jgi:Zn-dependent M28 family amino/carboxypeptidase
VQGEATPFTPGANDNASGVGVMLALAERLKAEPLKNTEVWWVATGCEEVGAYGSADFIRRNRNDLYDATIIVVDNVAGKGTSPTYLTSEGMLMPVRFSLDVLAIAEQVAAKHPELQARPHDHQGVYTDAAPALQAGVKALSLVGQTREGWIPDWHNASDTFGAVEADAVAHVERFVWEVLQKLDE